MRQTAGELVAYVLHRAPVLDCTVPGEGRSVLVLPGIGRGDRQTARFRAALDKAGFRSAGWGLGVNIGPTRSLLAGAAARLKAVAAVHGRVSIVGFSMGGLFARWLALEHPECVRSVVTVCSPFRNPLESLWLPLPPLTFLWPDAPSLAARIAGPLPVPSTCLYTRRDGIVAWRNCFDPCAPQDSFEIQGAHVTMAIDQQVLSIVAARLG